MSLTRIAIWRRCVSTLQLAARWATSSSSPRSRSFSADDSGQVGREGRARSALEEGRGGAEAKSVNCHQFFHLGEERNAALRLPGFAGAWGSDYAYEALNLVDGRRSTLEIRDALAATYGPVPLELVEEYLEALLAAKLLLR